jgi:hypothetical protein
MTKRTVKEGAVQNLAFLLETELDKAQVVIATNAILDKLQGMAEDLAKIEADDIMPILDNMRLTFGPEMTDSFNDITTAKIRQTMEAVKDAKESITREVGRMENIVNGDQANDISGGDAGPGLDSDLAGAGDDLDVPPMGADQGLDAPADDDLDVPPMPGAEDGADGDGDDLDAAFADAGQSAAGRARKESIERNVKALRESKNPDRLIFETYKREWKKSHKVVETAKAVAIAFDIDFSDVVSIIKEGKTFPKGKKKENPFAGRAARRAAKKKGQDAVASDDEIDESKTFRKGEKGVNPFAKRDAERKEKDKKKPKFDDHDIDENAKPSFKAGSTAGKPSGALAEDVFNHMKPAATLSDYRTKTLDVSTREEAEARALADFRKSLNRSMEVPYIYTMDDNQEVQQFNSHGGDPFLVKVISTEQPLISSKWHNGTLDPSWRVSVVKGKGVIPANVKAGWIDGPSYRVLPQRKR